MKKSKLITLVLALALVVTSIFAVAVVAGAADEVKLPTIAGKNLYYEENTSIAVKVSYEGTLSAGAKLGILVWDKATYDGTAATVIHKSFEPQTVNGMTGFYLTQPIEAGNLSYPYMIAAAIDNGDGTYTIGEIQECSVVKYAYQKLGEKNTLVETSRVCQTLIKYAAAADNVITNTANVAQFGYIKAVGGTVNAFSTFGGINGKSVVLRADAVNADGKYFAGWTVDGVLVSTERVLVATVPADATGAVEYVATYGDEGQGYVVNLDDLNLGNFTTIDKYLTVSGTNPQNVMMNVAGMKYLLVEETKGVSGRQIVAYADNVRKYTEASVDFAYASRNDNGTLQIITVSGYFNDSTTAIDLRLNVTSNKAKGSISLYYDNRNIITGNLDYITGTQKFVPLAAEQLMTFTAKANLETDSLDLYFNGEHYGSAYFKDFLVCAEDTGKGYETKRTELANAFNVATYTTTDSVGHRNYFIYDNEGNFVYKDGSCTFKAVKKNGTTITTTTFKYENGTLTQIGDAVVTTNDKNIGDTLYTCEMVEVVSYGTPGDVTSFTFSSISMSAFSSSTDDSIFYEANFR